MRPRVPNISGLNMNNDLQKFISELESKQFATATGRAIHAKLQKITLSPTRTGDPELIAKIESMGDELTSFFGANSKSELPIAGFINGEFLSRRIDRLVVDDATKTVRVLDYKTDINTAKFRDKYIAKMNEYIKLMQKIYPCYKVDGYILWLHNWTLERI